MHDDEVDGAKPTPPALLTPEEATWTWFAYRPPDGALRALGRTPAEARAQLEASAEEDYVDIEPDPDRAELSEYIAQSLQWHARGTLVCVHARSELEAWGAWVGLSELAERMAFRRWRRVFPRPAGHDLVGRDVRRRMSGGRR